MLKLKGKIKFNIFDLNFILVFAGFAIFTSFFESVSSIAYRAVALIVSLICLMKTGLHMKELHGKSKWVFWFLVIMHAKSYFHILAETTSVFSFVFIYMAGVIFLPVVAFMFSYRRINWNTVLPVLAVLLFVTVAKGVNTALEIDTLERMQLNARQSTLAFGDNSSYLLLLGLVTLRFLGKVNNNIGRFLIQVFAVLAVIVSVYGLAKAGSRGPLLAGVMGALYILLTLKLSRGLTIVVLGLMAVSISGLTMQSLKAFAPVLYNRMNSTVSEGDTSGRDILFEGAIKRMNESPILGSNPIVITGDGTEFTTCHNGYLDVGVCLGVFGFILYIYITLWIILRLWRYRSKMVTPQLLFMSAMFFLTSTRAMSGGSMLTNSNYIIAMFGAAMSIHALAMVKSHELQSK